MVSFTSPTHPVILLVRLASQVMGAAALVAGSLKHMANNQSAKGWVGCVSPSAVETYGTGVKACSTCPNWLHVPSLPKGDFIPP